MKSVEWQSSCLIACIVKENQIACQAFNRIIAPAEFKDVRQIVM